MKTNKQTKTKTKTHCDVSFSEFFFPNKKYLKDAKM